MTIYESYSTDVDPIVQHNNRVWHIQYKPVGIPLMYIEMNCAFDKAVDKVRSIAHKNKGIMITCRFPKHIDDQPRDYSSFYIIVRD